MRFTVPCLLCSVLCALCSAAQSSPILAQPQRETGIAANWIEHRLHLEIRQPATPLLVALLQPMEQRIGIAAGRMNHRIGHRRHIALGGHPVQLRERRGRALRGGPPARGWRRCRPWRRPCPARSGAPPGTRQRLVVEALLHVRDPQDPMGLLRHRIERHGSPQVRDRGLRLPRQDVQPRQVRRIDTDVGSSSTESRAWTSASSTRPSATSSQAYHCRATL